MSIHSVDSLTVTPGCTVRIQLAKGGTEEWTLFRDCVPRPVLEDNVIALDSPLAKAVQGHQIGERVRVIGPDGAYEVEIIGVFSA
jgi:transcription elongation GreA/GreB family factor